MATTKSKKSIPEKKTSEFDNHVREMFDSIDINGDKTITVDELAIYLRKINVSMSMKELKESIRKLDKNKNGRLEFGEFRDFIKQQSIECKRTQGSTDIIKQTFCMFDKDGNGVIDKKELKLALRVLLGERDVTNDDLKEMMAEVDLNEDGVIDYEEFEQIWWSLNGQHAEAE